MQKDSIYAAKPTPILIAIRRMEKPYLNPIRTEEDFVKAVVHTLAETPLASRTFVCNGLNTHKSESLV